MRIVVHGQQAFGKAVLEALLTRSENIIAVYVAPQKPGQKPDPLKEAALAASLPVHEPASYKTSQVHEAFRALKPDLQVMAFVTLFVPEAFLSIPRFGSIQYHPSLLPKFRGASAINWPIILGETQTGLSIFWPDNGLDTGDVLLQKRTSISNTDTLGSVYFDRLFPMGVAALVEVAEKVVSGRASEIVQDESQATYEGWCRAEEARVNWHNHVDVIYNLIRGCNPAPAAWTLFKGKKLQLFDARKHTFHRFAEVQGSIGSVTAVGAESVFVTAQGGQIEVFKLKYGDGKKLAAPQVCAEAGLAAGAVLGE